MTIKKTLLRLVEAYNCMVRANESFIDKNSGSEGFRNLIDQRNLIIEDIDLLASELAKEINLIYREHSFPCKTIPEAVRALFVLAPELSGECDSLKESLRELVKSDLAVEANVAKLKDVVKDEIQKIRKGSRVIKGYKQADPMGSCFINKVK